MQESLHKIVTSEEEGDDYNKLVTELKDSVLDHINEFHTELETRWISKLMTYLRFLRMNDINKRYRFSYSIENITKAAIKHIHANEVILTIGKSAIVEAFFKEAAKERKFEVFVCECSPLNYVSTGTIRK